MDKNVLIASRKGKLWRINSDNGDWDWKDRKTNGDVVAGLMADYNAVYVPCMDQRVYAFRSDSGSELWETQLAGRLEEPPAPGGPVIIVISKDTGAYALSRVNGEIKWRAPDVRRVLASEDDSVWVVGDAGNIKSLSVDDGIVLAEAPAPGVGMYVRNTADKSVILVTQSGLVGMYGREVKKKEGEEEEP
jgi:outer membrane protein assembly factor BamB